MGMELFDILIYQTHRKCQDDSLCFKTPAMNDSLMNHANMNCSELLVKEGGHLYINLILCSYYTFLNNIGAWEYCKLILHRAHPRIFVFFTLEINIDNLSLLINDDLAK